MSIKVLHPLTTPQGTNEQTGVSQITVTTTGNTTREFPELGNFNRGIVFLDVSAVSGTTPTLVVALQMQDPISGKWHNTSAVFPSQNAITPNPPNITPLTLELYCFNYRIAWTVGGTGSPSFTFSCGVIAGSEVPVIP